MRVRMDATSAWSEQKECPLRVRTARCAQICKLLLQLGRVAPATAGDFRKEADDLNTVASRLAQARQLRFRTRCYER